MGVYKFEYWQSEIDGHWYFRFRASNGEIMFVSQSYIHKQSALDSIASLQRNVTTSTPIEEEPTEVDEFVEEAEEVLSELDEEETTDEEHD